MFELLNYFKNDDIIGILFYNTINFRELFIRTNRKIGYIDYYIDYQLSNYILKLWNKDKRVFLTIEKVINYA